MAVSGRKPQDFKESLSMGSTEDFDICCDPCLSEGHNAEAKEFCENCQENLCRPCLDAHRMTRASKHHLIENKPRSRANKSFVPKPRQNACTEVCHVHDKEIIQFFCRNHEILGCGDCVTLSHQDCHIDYIPDVCAGVAQNQEFKETLEDIIERLKESDSSSNETKICMANTKENIADTIKQVEEFQNKMNEKINTVKSNMIQDLKLADQHADHTLSTSNKAVSELKAVKAKLEVSQTTGQDAQAFTAMKQAQSRLKTYDISALKNTLLAELRTYRIEANNALVYILSTSERLGREIVISGTKSVPSAPTYYSLKPKKVINVRSKSDNSECNIKGCALLLPGKLVVTGWHNGNIKIVDVTEQIVTKEYTLPTYPFDVAVLPHDQVAVTSPNNEAIYILKTSGKLSILRGINVNRSCWGIAYNQDLLYVVCQRPSSVLVLDMQGTVQLDILLKSALKETFRHPCRISISKILKQMYISDGESNMVVSLTLQGKVNAVYKNKELKKPRGLTVLEDGSLLVCYYDNSTIHHISSDLTQGRKVADSFAKSKSICYDSYSKTAYVGSSSDLICEFSLE